MKKKILAVFAHSDDLEYYAAGTVAKFADRGYEAVLAMLTSNITGGDLDGDGNYLRHPPERIKPVRAAEMRAGAEILGVRSFELLDFKESFYFDGRDLAYLGDPAYDTQASFGAEPLPAAAIHPRCIERVQAVIEKHEPEIVVTHNFSSGFEHTCAAHLVNQAFGQALKKGADLGSLWMYANVRHCAWESDVRAFASPNILIDITEQWDRKVAAIRAHRSQGVEPTLEKVKIICRYWGIARGCQYAEPFCMLHDARYR